MILLLLMCCLASSLCIWVRFDFILLHELIWWLIRIRASIACNHALISIKWLIIVILFKSIIVNNNTLIHSHTHVGVKSSHVLKVVHLTLEESKVICEHLPVELLPNELVPLVLLVL